MAIRGNQPELERDEPVSRALLEELPLVAWLSDYDTSCVFYVNGEIQRMLGYSPAEWTADLELQESRVHEDDRAEYDGHVARVRADGRSHCEYRALARDGTTVWVHERSVVVPADGETPRHVQGFTLDVSAHRSAEEALRESEERYRLIVDTAAQGVWTIDADHITTFVNPRMTEILGVSAEEIVGSSVFDYVPEDMHEATVANIALLQEGERTQFERTLLRADGTRVEGLFTTSPLTNADGSHGGSLAMVTDVTERTRLQLELERTKQLEAIAALAGGVAHDFNNSMMAIRGFAELLLGRLAEDDPIRRDAEGIKHAADSAAALTRQLLAFGRKQVLQPELLDVSDTVRALAPMLRRTLGEKIELALDLAGGRAAVSVDPGQLEQVLLELTYNARDALPDGGRVSIRATEAAPAGHDEPYLLLAVSDDGVGIPAELQGSVVEPFFTTKELGRGTGMGLATVFGIVKQSGGHFELESELGRGSTFRVYFPLVGIDGDEGDVAIGAAASAETVLLVEDDDIVRSVVREMLDRLGYRVLHAASPAAALELAADAPVDVLLTDVVMPGMGGAELANRLSELQPGLRVLYMSGYTAGSIGSDGAVDAATAFLQKPFTLDSLKRKLVSLPERSERQLEPTT